ncbi:DNA-binding response regulator [Alcaligenes sp. SDU_A2]|uniref:DNA-binding response regulator n=1 Tax=Alcaligenes sp. SDU_A2 TaxID=3136634 RepID=UPI002D129667|nr:DNA-binding response regulator [Alcaligenes sp.]HRL28272.1 DNA-binding response regulator [Alcaligenes sp.]
MSVTNLVAGGPVVLYLSSVIPDRMLLEQQVQALAERGYRPISCRDFTALLQLAQSRGRSVGSVCIAWLGGALSDICAAAVRLRMLCPQVGILMQADYSDAAMLQALHSGADQLCPKNSSLELLAANLQSLQRRLIQVPTLSDPVQRADWFLAQEGWALVAPGGQSFALTTTERSFIGRLLQHPDRRASHHELLTAIAGTSGQIQDPPSALLINRLGVLVSRMRRKFSRGDAVLPVRSVHNWGYMFAAHCELRD